MSIARALSLLTAFVLALASWPACAASLRWASRGDAQTMDPHAALESVTINVDGLIYDTLVTVDRQHRVTPALATGWRVVAPTVWRFDLREGVRFHDGTALTADDVVFSIERAQQPDSKFTVYALPLGKAVRIDAHTIELRQPQPNPQLLEQLRFIMIMSRDWCLAHAAQRVPEPTAGEEAYTNRHAMGSGRYRLTLYEPGRRTLLARNAAWWGRPEGNVEQIVFQPIANDATRTAALLAGDIDFMQDVPVADVDRLQQDSGIRLLTGPESRLIFLAMDQYRDQLLESSVKDRNPFKDLRVRRAFHDAIDVEAIRSRIMRGQSEPTGCATGTARSCFAAAIERHPPPDIERARRLMKEAGYGDGFALTLDCPNDRYINDQAICTAVAAMLARIGVRVKVDARTKTLFFRKVTHYESSFFLYGFGQGGDEAQILLDPVVHGFDERLGKGSNNFGRFADARLDALLDAAAIEIQPARRTSLIGEAQQRVAEGHFILPLHRQSLTWAARSNVHAQLSSDNQVRPEWIQVD